MGLFDSVMAPCPKCGAEVEFQSKAGDCDMEVYRLDTAPAEVKLDILNDPHHCRACGNWFALVDPRHPPGAPQVAPTPANVRPPDNPITHHQGYRWWPDDRPFSYADLTDPVPEQ